MIQKLEDEQMEREMQEIARRAALRPIEVHPDRWNYRTKRQAQYSNYTYQQTPVVSSYENTEDKIDKKKKEKVRELLLSQPITGELYIDGDTKYWRKVVLKWINDNQSSDTLTVSLQKIIGYMKNTGVTFNQNDKIVKYPIKGFLEFYVKTLKVELKKKIELNIKE